MSGSRRLVAVLAVVASLLGGIPVDAAAARTDEQIVRAALREAWADQPRSVRIDLCNAWIRSDLRRHLVRSIARPIAAAPRLERRPVRRQVRVFLRTHC